MALKKWKVYLLGALIPITIGSIAGLLTMDSMEIYSQMAIKPPLAPPGWLFPVVWTVLYALMGIGSVMVWQAPPSTQRNRGLNLYVAQLIVNFFWSLIFFNAQAFGLAALWLILLWVLVILMTVQFWKVDQLAGKLQIPYLIWLTFAAYLNIAIWVMNR